MRTQIRLFLLQLRDSAHKIVREPLLCLRLFKSPLLVRCLCRAQQFVMLGIHRSHIRHFLCLELRHAASINLVRALRCLQLRL
ncbi:MAG: hypothetical protein GY832_06130 [Chloroflexi bacterium]|nr:hypothetical protein [Chloroflexota bacterium]